MDSSIGNVLGIWIFLGIRIFWKLEYFWEWRFCCWGFSEVIPQNGFSNLCGEYFWEWGSWKWNPYLQRSFLQVGLNKMAYWNGSIFAMEFLETGLLRKRGLWGSEFFPQARNLKMNFSVRFFFTKCGNRGYSKWRLQKVALGHMDGVDIEMRGRRVAYHTFTIWSNFQSSDLVIYLKDFYSITLVLLEV